MSESTARLNGPHFVVTADAIHGEDTPENREIVRRIHACVNACDGISTEELERGIITDMRRVIQQVVPVLQQRPSAPAMQTIAKRTPLDEILPQGAD